MQRQATISIVFWRDGADMLAGFHSKAGFHFLARAQKSPLDQALSAALRWHRQLFYEDPNTRVAELQYR